ncbi:MAG TPA: group 1 truncated hemoglobin [Gammaproteobacteria bacterium]|nr:group 1 truncated hemoglobin [Gammaproteobacteria bacterium]
MNAVMFTLGCLVAMYGISMAAAGDEASGVELSADVSQRLADLEAQCAARPVSADGSSANLYERLGGEERIHVIVREMVRLHHRNPAVRNVVEKYNPDYLADVLGRYLVTATGGPQRYAGPPLAETHAHLHLTSAQFIAGGDDLVAAMTNVGVSATETLDLMCLLVPLRSQIAHE